MRTIILSKYSVQRRLHMLTVSLSPRRAAPFHAVLAGFLLLGAQAGVRSGAQTPAVKTTTAKPAAKPAATPAPGSLTGTITNTAHKPVNNAHTLIASGVMVTAEAVASAGIRNPDAFGRGVLGAGESPGRRAASNSSAGGLYTLSNLTPGVYNLMVEAGEISATRYRPQRIMGVVVRAGQETTLDITLHEGDALEEVGEPTLSASGMRGRGWLEGTIVTPDGTPVHSARALLATGVIITVGNSTGTLGGFKTDHMAGGFFSLENVVPGTYSFLIEAGVQLGKKYRPQQIKNIVVKPGQRTVLSVVVSEGDSLERVDASSSNAVKMQPFKVLPE